MRSTITQRLLAALQHRVQQRLSGASIELTAGTHSLTFSNGGTCQHPWHEKAQFDGALDVVLNDSANVNTVYIEALIVDLLDNPIAIAADEAATVSERAQVLLTAVKINDQTYTLTFRAVGTLLQRVVPVERPEIWINDDPQPATDISQFRKLGT